MSVCLPVIYLVGCLVGYLVDCLTDCLADYLVICSFVSVNQEFKDIDIDSFELLLEKILNSTEKILNQL